MDAITRRTFLGKSAAGAAGAACLTAAGRILRADPLGIPLGSQTWPHRQRIKSGDLAGLIHDMKGLGIVNVEMCSPGYPEFAHLTDGKEVRRIIEDQGLKCPSAHFTLHELRTAQQQAIAWAHDIGMTQMGTASLDGRVVNGVTTMDAVKRAADEYNKIGETARSAGIQQFLHDEGFEMSKVDGQRTYEVLLGLLDPKLVKMQFQMSAMPAVGDPVMYFTKYPGRFISMHLQGVNQTTPGSGHEEQVAVGHDSLDWPKIFQAAKTGGLQNYFIEQSWDLTVQSAAYLKTLS